MTIIMPPPTWTYYNETSHQSGKITITSLSPDHIEFKDIHGNTPNDTIKPSQYHVADVSCGLKSDDGQTHMATQHLM